jgi:hypothetical protein
VIDDGEGIAGVEGMLADGAAELDDVAAGLTVCEAKGCQFQEIAEHGKEVPGVDSVATRLWVRLFFHFGSIDLGESAVRIFSWRSFGIV